MDRRPTRRLPDRGRGAGGRLLSAFLLASSAVGGPEREVRYTCHAANARESAAQTLAVGCGGKEVLEDLTPIWLAKAAPLSKSGPASSTTCPRVVTLDLWRFSWRVEPNVPSAANRPPGTTGSLSSQYNE
ncbi:hypothetical protein NHX12_000204, partial [Muraenolepis orangiensis]